MPRANPFEPWLHQASGFWCQKVSGRLHYLDRDDAIAKSLLRKLILERDAGKLPESDWLQRPLVELCDEFLEDIKARKCEGTYVAYKHRLLRGLRILDAVSMWVR